MVRKPRRFAVHAMRQAISPRLAMSTEPNMDKDFSERLAARQPRAAGCTKAFIAATARAAAGQRRPPQSSPPGRCLALRLAPVLRARPAVRGPRPDPLG